jgi:hypothetical protein
MLSWSKMYWICLLNYSSLCCIRYCSTSGIPNSFASSLSFLLVKIEYKVPLTYVLTYRLSCSTRSFRTLRSSTYGSSHLSLPAGLSERFIKSAVAYSIL